MTTKLNLTPLIKYFEDRNATIATRLSGLVKTSANKEDQRKFESAMLDPQMRSLMDAFLNTKKPTPEQFLRVKDALKNFLDTVEGFGLETSHFWKKVIDEKRSPLQLGEWYYGMIQSSEGRGLKRFQSNQVQLQKIANTLIEIADELDSTDPELAAEADSILQDMIKGASAGCSQMLMPGHSCSEKCMGSMVMAPQNDHSGHFEMGEPEEMEEESSHSFDIEDLVEVEDPMLEELQEPEVERDMVTLDDLRDRLASMKWRIADKGAREALEKAIMYVEKAQQGHGFKKNYLNKAHEVFDHAGLALRVKDFE